MISLLQMHFLGINTNQKTLIMRYSNWHHWLILKNHNIMRLIYLLFHQQTLTKNQVNSSNQWVYHHHRTSYVLIHQILGITTQLDSQESVISKINLKLLYLKETSLMNIFLSTQLQMLELWWTKVRSEKVRTFTTMENKHKRISGSKVNKSIKMNK